MLGDTAVEVPEQGELPDCKSVNELQSSNLSPDRLLAKIKGRKEKIQGIPLVELSNSGMMGYSEYVDTLYLMWIEERKEWIGIHNFYIPGGFFNACDILSTPFQLDERFARKILEAYGELEELPLKQVLHTSPSQLEKIVFPRALKDCLLDYTVLKKVGSGATRDTFLARFKDKELRVIKLMKQPGEMKEKIRQNLGEWLPSREEIDVLLTLHHDHIAKLYDWEGDTYTIEQYVEGETLKQSLQRQGKIPPHKLGFFYDILEAAAYVHGKSFVHRDLKPSNIILYKENFKTRALVTDFQTARKMKNDEIEWRMQVHSDAAYYGQGFGHRYAAPELHSQGRASKSSDLYSLVCILAECLSGKRPPWSEQNAGSNLNGETDREMLYQYIDECKSALRLSFTENYSFGELYLQGFGKYLDQSVRDLLREGLAYHPLDRRMVAYDKSARLGAFKPTPHGHRSQPTAKEPLEEIIELATNCMNSVETD